MNDKPMTKKAKLIEILKEVPEDYKLINNIVVPLHPLYSNVERELVEFDKNRKKKRSGKSINYEELAKEFIKNGFRYFPIIPTSYYDVNDLANDSSESYIDDLLEDFIEASSSYRKMVANEPKECHDLAVAIGGTVTFDLFRIMNEFGLFECDVSDKNDFIIPARVFRLRYLDEKNKLLWIQQIELPERLQDPECEWLECIEDLTYNEEYLTYTDDDIDSEYEQNMHLDKILSSDTEKLSAWNEDMAEILKELS